MGIQEKASIQKDMDIAIAALIRLKTALRYSKDGNNGKSIFATTGRRTYLSSDVICYILCLLSIVRAPRTNRVRVQVQGFFKKIFLVMCIDLAVSKRLVG